MASSTVEKMKVVFEKEKGYLRTKVEGRVSEEDMLAIFEYAYVAGAVDGFAIGANLDGQN